MIDTTREIIAYGLIAAGTVCLVPWLGYVLVKRRREKLRRRGVKRYGH